MAPFDSHLLQLPVELLQTIFGLLDECNLLSLRLSCRSLERTTFDAFVSHYFQTVECFFLDPSRVQRLLSICSTKRLADQIRNLNLTLNAFEGREDSIVFTENKPRIRLGGWPPPPRKNYQHEYYSDQLEYYGAQPSDYRPVIEALRYLNPRKTILNVTVTPPAFPRVSQPQTEAHKILPAIEAVEYPIHSIGLDYKEDLYPDLSPQKLPSVLTEVRFLACRPFVDDNKEGITSSVEAICGIVPSLTKLQSFHFATMNQVWPRRAPQIYTFNKAIATLFSMSLRELGLSFVELTNSSDLIQLLTRHSERIEAVSLDHITFISKEDRWREIFKALLSMRKLSFLRLSALGDANGNSKSFHHPSWPNPEARRMMSCNEQTRNGARAELSILIECESKTTNGDSSLLRIHDMG